MRWESFPWHLLKCIWHCSALLNLLDLGANHWCLQGAAATNICGPRGLPAPSFSIQLPSCPLQLSFDKTIDGFRLTPKEESRSKNLHCSQVYQSRKIARLLAGLQHVGCISWPPALVLWGSRVIEAKINVFGNERFQPALCKFLYNVIIREAKEPDK